LLNKPEENNEEEELKEELLNKPEENKEKIFENTEIYQEINDEIINDEKLLLLNEENKKNIKIEKSNTIPKKLNENSFNLKSLMKRINLFKNELKNEILEKKKIKSKLEELNDEKLCKICKSLSIDTGNFYFF
jgi:hypothetical protein